ncbi:M42 family metallopeptidase [Truepera radiovictrix]|uniref:Peptidase M42 family protein n=1 Tax=Truepera radiovictrix (strain DSM 17093 / CIP 108686 / LMG 22925 / RQ-24) TaxID=649638 RepID=D7CTZ5_TRURR|nr:M42 family metallopeptidase [Truepera radiovictrix]ADI13893.1 peptidase M42 family protein [Truepera radiovictrix DSM 17093]WMT57543.1 M42 family metallopeptidase [Truepera radiovictrix]
MHQAAFLYDLLRAPGTSAFEGKPAAVWRRQAEAYGATLTRDTYGNSFASFGPSRQEGVPRVMLAGHLDEIGLIITHIDKEGFLYFKGVGGWDAQQLVGQRVRVVGYRGELLGVIGKKPIHLMESEERTKVSKIESLWIDIGAKSGDEAKAHVRAGDFAVIEQPVIELLNGRLVSKAIDNRLGAYIALEAARRAAEAGANAEVVAVATVQEEIGGVGAYIAAHALTPDVAIAIDVTHATDVPTVDVKREGERPFGSGAELSVGSFVHRGVLERLIATAEARRLPYTLGTSPARTHTDADDIAKNRAGVPTAVVSVPNRYMHSPVEMVDPEDVENVIRLLVAFLEGLGGGVDFTL